MKGKEHTTIHWRLTRGLRALVFCWLSAVFVGGCAGDMPRSPQLELSGTHTYHCERDTDVTVTFINNAVDSYYAVALHFEGTHYVLPRSGLGSGVKYSKRGVSWWTNGEQGILEKDKKIRLADCLIATLNPVPPTSDDTNSNNVLGTVDESSTVEDQSGAANTQSTPAESLEVSDAPATVTNEPTEDPKTDAVEIESTLPILPSSNQVTEQATEQAAELSTEQTEEPLNIEQSSTKSPPQQTEDFDGEALIDGVQQHSSEKSERKDPE